MYTFSLSISKLERGSKLNKKQEPMPGLYVEGTQTKADGTTSVWKKFLMDWNAAEAISVIEQVGVGGTVSIGMEKENNFWNIKQVTPMGSSYQAPPTQAPPPQAPQQQSLPLPQTQAVAVPQSAPVDDKFQETFAVEQAVKLTIAMLHASIIKGAKVTSEVVVEGTMLMAERIAEFLDGKKDNDNESDASPLNHGDEDPGPGEDDIPF